MFGTASGIGSDLVNLSSQYSACSHGQFTFVPASGAPEVVDGVLSISVAAVLPSDLGDTGESLVLAHLAGLNLSIPGEHLLIVLPPLPGSPWLAYAVSRRPYPRSH